MNRKLVLSAVMLALALVVSGGYILSTVLDVPLTHRSLGVTVQMPQTGGLYDGSMVAYRGSRVGVVRHLDVTATGVVAKIKITSGKPIPADLTARVRSMSPVGEQYLDLEPHTTSGPMLHDGSVIKATSVNTPVLLASAAGSLADLLGSVDTDDLHTVLAELSTGLHGTDDDLGVLLDSTDQLVGSLDRVWPQTDRLLHHGRTVLEVGADKQATIGRFAHDARHLAAYLRGYDPSFRNVIATAPGNAKQVSAFLEQLTAYLQPFFAALDETTHILAEHDPHLRALTGSLAPGLGRFASAFRNGELYVSLLFQNQQRCSYGKAKTDPTLVDRKPLNTGGHCALDSPVTRRGAQHAPPPKPLR